MNKSKKQNQRTLWTFQPDDDVVELLARATEKLRDGNERKNGVRTRLINEALRQSCGKQESKN